MPRMKKTPKRSDKLIMQHYRKHQESANESRGLEEGRGLTDTPQVRRMNMRISNHQIIKLKSQRTVSIRLLGMNRMRH